MKFFFKDIATQGKVAQSAGSAAQPATNANQADASGQLQGEVFRFSLKWRMIQMLLICWVMPVVLVALIGGAYLHQSLKVQSMERLSLSVEGAVSLATMRLDAAIAASRATSYVGTVRDAWTQYKSDGDTMVLYDTTRSYLEQQYQTDEEFYSTILVFTSMDDNPIYVVNGSIGGTDRVRDDMDEIWATASAISETLDTSITFFSAGERVFMVRNLVDANYNTFAVLMMELNTGLIFTEFSQIANLEIAAAVLDDVTLTLSLENRYARANLIRTLADLPIDASAPVGSYITYRNDAMHAEVRLVGSDYTLAFYAISYPSILHEQWGVTVIVLALVFLLMLPLGALILNFFMQHVNRPLQAMITLAEDISNEHYGQQLPEYVLQSQEIGALGDNFNQMSLTLQQQFDHIYKEEIALRDAKIMALQSQINPHFLNNTLEIINWEARMQGNIKVCNMLESLSIMLNAAMDRRARRSVALSEELMYVDAYMYIIGERLGKRLVFTKDIPEQLLDCRVPRLILQPILENAVNHGIASLPKGNIS